MSNVHQKMVIFNACAVLLMVYISVTQSQEFTPGQIAAAIQQARQGLGQRRLNSANNRQQGAGVGGGGRSGGGTGGIITGHRLFTRRNDEQRNQELSNGAATLEAAFQILRDGGGSAGFARSGFSQQSSAIFMSESNGLCDNLPNEFCDPQQRYRVTSGQCNNLLFQSQPSLGFKLGAAFTAQGRFLPPAYDDGISRPRIRSVIGGLFLPNARLISNNIHSGNAFTSDRHTPFLTHFGQIIDHDIVATPSAEPDFNMMNSHCCLEPNVQECFNINFHFDDVLGGTCIPFARADISPDFFCTPGAPRQQQNQRSSFVDGSMIYGFDTEKENALRLPNTGFLISDNDDQLKLEDNGVNGVFCFPFSEPKCFDAGDHRSMETVTLTVMHIAFLRRHNLIVSALQSINPSWSSELLFQEAKKIVIAELQHILYNEFLPRVLGRDTMLAYQLFSAPPGFFADPYSPLVDPRTTSGFSVAAYRFGHSLVRNIHNQIGPFGNPIRPLNLQDHFDVPMTLLRPFPGGATEGYARWMATDPKSRGDRTFVDGLRNNLFRCNESPDPNGPGPFGPRCLVGGQATAAFDLAALNIQRGRDHGLPSYTRWRYECTGKRTFIFTPNYLGLSDHSPFEANLLKNTYRHVDDIDLFTGAMTETRLPGALVGPTFACIIAAQFRNYKRGDRFWYERPDPVLAFTPGQLAAIKQTTLAKVICSTMKGLENVQEQIMDVPSFGNIRRSCNELRSQDLIAKLPHLWNHLPENAYRSAVEKARLNSQPNLNRSRPMRRLRTKKERRLIQSLRPTIQKVFIY